MSGEPRARRSIGEALRDADGRPSGFDYMRIVLACLVVVVHSFSTSSGVAADRLLWDSPFGPLARLVLPMFFALSGFLVAGSMMRCRTILMFLGLRVIRIYPALAVEVFLSALLIGPLVTQVPLADYLRSPVFARYLVNMTGDVSFVLPGVFVDNPVPRIVNAQLWTVPFELLCYISITACILLGGKRMRVVVPVVATLMATAHLGHRVRIGRTFDVPLDHVPGYLLIVFFLAGVSAYSYRDRIAFDRRIGLASALASVALMAFPMGEYPALLPVTYLTVFVGLLNPRRVAILRGADYSYGVFLYGYVIQQSLMWLFPMLRLWWCNALAALPLAFVFAFFSWTFVEKPALRLKRPLTRLEDAWLRFRGQDAAAPDPERSFVRPSAREV